MHDIGHVCVSIHMRVLSRDQSPKKERRKKKNNNTDDEDKKTQS